MKCPSCKTTDLKAVRLDEGLPAHGCSECGGAIIPLLYYRDWAERTAHDKPDSNAELDANLAMENESYSALACPKCSKLMSKFNISGCTKNRLDLCNSCDEAWLDGGEWELLKALQLSKNIPSIFTEVWQRKVRKEISENKRKERLAKIISPSDVDKVEDIRLWLNKHEYRAEILFYLNLK